MRNATTGNALCSKKEREEKKKVGATRHVNVTRSLGSGMGEGMEGTPLADASRGKGRVCLHLHTLRVAIITARKQDGSISSISSIVNRFENLLKTDTESAYFPCATVLHLPKCGRKRKRKVRFSAQWCIFALILLS